MKVKETQILSIKEIGNNKMSVQCLKTGDKFSVNESTEILITEIAAALKQLGSAIVTRGWDDTSSRTILAIEFVDNMVVGMLNLERELVISARFRLWD